MIDALVAGQLDPEVLAEMAKGRMRSKIHQLEYAPAGRFNAHHALLCRATLARIDQADATIAELTERIVAVPGMCPGNNESAGKHRSGRTRYGSKWLRIPQVEAAQAAGRFSLCFDAPESPLCRTRRDHLMTSRSTSVVVDDRAHAAGIPKRSALRARQG